MILLVIKRFKYSFLSVILIIFTSPHRSAVSWTLAVICLHLILSLAAWTTWFAVYSSPKSPTKLSIYFILCLPLALLPSILPVRHKCSIFSDLIICPRKFICLFLISFISDLCIPILASTSSFLTLSLPWRNYWGGDDVPRKKWSRFDSWAAILVVARSSGSLTVVTGMTDLTASLVSQINVFVRDWCMVWDGYCFL